MRIYGQSRLFEAFVRKTGSVNGSYFVKCAKLSVKFAASLFRLDIIKDSINYESRLFLSKSKHFLHFSGIY